ncbi:pseudouridine synthase [Rheinheimera aquimaris]|jgi:tRNA pseudouridine32 synthase/23S rRNA pseudouridine746 synthase|uniref:pseudouridine synthase n=1 Tax=Rheinheimera aquimaris TaxID=412437 RepID=UPI0010670FF8|nr:pseudouridine synthase [Rheinheimera aquimaris]MCD1599289.1 RNA pseudouridine synthase [Rheinheimera aquimaris]|tara:strand:+ start:4419 stop:5123 length:705 start_codon:yes stop_codon:yes gene_type:complete
MMRSFFVVDEQHDFVVLDKAPGISFHSDDGPGLAAIAAKTLGYELFPVHRLDKVTSGLIILARSSSAAAELTALFTLHQVEKYYLALSTGRAAKKQGWVKGDMAPARRSAWKLLTSQHNPAVTYFVSQGYDELPFRAYLLKPFSGKTHQIRVAMKSLGAPISGDVLYQAEMADRVYLHAYALQFTVSGQQYRYVAAPQYGDKFQQLIQHDGLSEWLLPWQLNWPQYRQPKQVRN